MEDDLTFLEALGVRVYWLDGLPSEALYLDDHHVLLLRSDLSQARARSMCQQALVRVSQSLAS